MNTKQPKPELQDETRFDPSINDSSEDDQSLTNIQVIRPPKHIKFSSLALIFVGILSLFLVAWLIFSPVSTSNPVTNLHQNIPSNQSTQGQDPKKNQKKDDFLPKEQTRPASETKNSNKTITSPPESETTSNPTNPSKTDIPSNPVQPPQDQSPHPIDSPTPLNETTSVNSTITLNQSTPSSQDLSPSEQEALCQAQNWQLKLQGGARRKIYDLFMIATEVDILEIRLAQMWNEVDYFVILESPTTFKGYPKPLTVLENWDKFERFHSKMIRHTLNIEGQNFKDTWAHERFQRDAIYDQIVPQLTGDQKIEQGDVILVSDADELVRDQVLQTLRYCDFPRKLTLGSKIFYYSYEFLSRGPEWVHPQATYYDGANTVKPQELRDEQGNFARITYHNAGWHCSYCFGKIDDIAVKLHSFSHQEYNTPEYTNRAKILRRVINGVDLFDRYDPGFARLENNEDIPQYVKDNKEKFNYMISRPSPTGNFADFKPEDAALLN